MMSKTYRHTGSEEDYTIYKEVVNQATAEMRNSKRSYGQKMTENLNEYISSVFTREDIISALRLPETKLEGRGSDYLGQLIVNPKMVAKKI